MQTQRLVLPADLNQFGALFGGRLLAWIDEASWIAASIEFPHARFVTVGMKEVRFRHGVREGTIITIDSTLLTRGRTSVTYRVSVVNALHPQGEPLFATEVTFVHVDANGQKQALPC
jgi:acyl-CoA hydrolase